MANAVQCFFYRTRPSNQGKVRRMSRTAEGANEHCAIDSIVCYTKPPTTPHVRSLQLKFPQFFLFAILACNLRIEDPPSSPSLDFFRPLVQTYSPACTYCISLAREPSSKMFSRRARLGSGQIHLTGTIPRHTLNFRGTRYHNQIHLEQHPLTQTLIYRGSIDPDFKALAGLVGNAQASPDELKRFQSHIDLIQLHEGQYVARRIQPRRIQAPLSLERRLPTLLKELCFYGPHKLISWQIYSVALAVLGGAGVGVFYYTHLDDVLFTKRKQFNCTTLKTATKWFEENGTEMAMEMAMAKLTVIMLKKYAPEKILPEHHPSYVAVVRVIKGILKAGHLKPEDRPWFLAVIASNGERKTSQTLGAIILT
jgi:hypothetical protein